MTYFLASNGLLYRDPFIQGEGYFIVFDGDDEPEIVIAAGEGESKLDATTARLRAASILEQSGLSAVLAGPPRQMMRAFDADGAVSRDSFCFWLDVEEPIPAELVASAEGVTVPAGDTVVVSFGQPWG